MLLDRSRNFITTNMSSVIQSSVVVLPHRHSVFLLCALLAVASSFSTHLSSSGTCPSKKNANGLYTNSISRPHGSNLPQTGGSPLVLLMSSQITTTEDSQKVGDLFSKYCDKDSLIDRKTLESMPPFADMLVSSVGFPDVLS